MKSPLGVSMTQEQATRLFYEHVWPLRATLLRTARFLARNSAEADDLAQETLVKAYRSIATFDASTHAVAWLHTILRNTRIDHIRSRQRESHDLSIESHALEVEDRCRATAPGDFTDPGALLEQFSDAQLIEALQELPEEIRWTLLLVDVEQLEFAEAAIVMDVPLGTAKSRAHRGRQMIRERLMDARHETANGLEK